MKIGIDFYDTITDNPSKFRRYIRQLKDEGHTIYVISAIYSSNLSRLQKDYKKVRIHCELVPVFYSQYNDVPELKYKKCMELGIDLMIDDRIDTCSYIYSMGKMVEHYTNWRELYDRFRSRSSR